MLGDFALLPHHGPPVSRSLLLSVSLEPFPQQETQKDNADVPKQENRIATSMLERKRYLIWYKVLHEEEEEGEEDEDDREVGGKSEERRCDQRESSRESRRRRLQEIETQHSSL